MNPLVSIVIPVYNGSNYMREAVDSALSQTYPNIEIIVVNDGSTDNTREIALSYGDKIRYFEKENGGGSTALNLGIREMKGEYFSWLSHDDVYYPNKVEAEIDALKANGDMDMAVYSGWDELHMPKRKIKHFYSLRERNSDFYITSGLWATILGLISGCSLLIPKSYFDEYGLFDENLRLTQDYAKWFQMFHDKKLVYVDKYLIQSRFHEAQQGNTNGNFQNECDELHLWMIKEAEKDTKNASSYKFYNICLLMTIFTRYEKTYEYVLNKLRQFKESANAKLKREELKKYFESKSKDGIYIYCAGKRGKALIKILRCLGIKVLGISDSDKALWGRYIEGMLCVSPNELPKNQLLIISMRNPTEVKEILTSQGFSNIMTFDDFWEMLYEISIKFE